MIEMVEYQQRRARLLEQMEDNSIAIIAAAPEQVRTGDTYYRYRQNNALYYLTGFSEPQSIAVLIAGATDEFILFNRPNDKNEEIWNGIRAGQKGALEHYCADKAYPIGEFDQRLMGLLKGKSSVYFSFGNDRALEQKISLALQSLNTKVRGGMGAPTSMKNVDSIVDEMRLIKSEGEINLMRKVAEISAQAHLRAIKNCRHYEYEYQLEADLHYEFMRHGCRAPAYDSIVGGGKNACILHYTQNDAELSGGDLVLIDAGGEYQNYAADITRTFPSQGQFSTEQKAIYDIVLKAQLAGIELVKPGMPWNSIQQIMVLTISEGLLDLGLLRGDLDELIETQAYKAFYMHNSGHWLGLDVHDVGSYKVNGQWRPLQAGMVLTVEPGIYIDDSHQDIDPCWHNIGIRIEDDVLVTAEGCDVLTSSVPKTIEEIEALMAGN